MVLNRKAGEADIDWLSLRRGELPFVTEAACFSPHQRHIILSLTSIAPYTALSYRLGIDNTKIDEDSDETEFQSGASRMRGQTAS